MLQATRGEWRGQWSQPVQGLRSFRVPTHGQGARMKQSVMFLLTSAACAVALRIAYEALDVSQGVDLALAGMDERIAAMDGFAKQATLAIQSLQRDQEKWSQDLRL